VQSILSLILYGLLFGFSIICIGHDMSFEDYFQTVQDKAGQRLERSAVQYLFDQGKSVMDCVVLLTYRRP